MAKKRVRQPVQEEKDRRNISRLYLQGVTQVEIARELKISQPTVSRELKLLQAEWRVERVFDINEAKQRELAKIDNLEIEYWLAWKRSQTETVIKTKKATKILDMVRDQELSERTETSVGDARFLNGVMDCIKQRCAILGVEAPKKQELTGKDGKPLPSLVNVYIPQNNRENNANA